MQIKETAAPYKPKTKIYSYEDYVKLPDDRNRYEIINGELIMTPAPKIIHQSVSGVIDFELRSFLKNKNLGKVFTAPTDVVLSKTNVVQPDILFIGSENKNIISEDNIQGAPDLIIEIISLATAYYDLIEKKEIYEKFEVQEYWIVDPKKQRVEIYILQQGKYKLHQSGEKAATVHSKLLEDFKIDLKEVFKETE